MKAEGTAYDRGAIASVICLTLKSLPCGRLFCMMLEQRRGRLVLEGVIDVGDDADFLDVRRVIVQIFYREVPL